MFSRAFTSVGFGLALAIVLVGCGAAPTEPTAAQPTEGTAEAGKTPERLIFSFQRQKDPAQVKADAERVAKILSDEIGIPVEVQVPTAYSATVQALVSERAHVAYLSSTPFILAEREAPVEVMVAEERKGKTTYDAVFVVRADSTYRTLADLKGKTMAFTSPTSASGYVFPYGEMVKEGLLEAGAKPETFFGKTLFAGGYDRALQAVVRGQADVAAVSDYTVEGDKTDKYISKEDLAQLRVLFRVPNVPTHLIAVRADLAPELKAKIKAALLKLSETQPEALADVYGASKFVSAEGNHVQSARDALKRTGLDVKSVVE